MARLARLVVPSFPHHITQRGNRRLPTFFDDDDYTLYKYLLSKAAGKAGSEIWCYCLMPNHVHIIIVPSHDDGLRGTFADAHRRYTGYINARMRATGHLWQGRFGSVVVNEEHLANAVRYVSLNPVRARLVDRAKDWNWSSVNAHLTGEDDGIKLRCQFTKCTNLRDHLLHKNHANHSPLHIANPESCATPQSTR